MVLVLTGNSEEPECGPATLSKEELVHAFVGGGLFTLLECKTGRFDRTPQYDQLPECPLSHEALFRRTGAPLLSPAGVE
jgi:hypothetical protein